MGYHLGIIGFRDGDPVEPSTSKTAVHPVLSNKDVTACPDACFRPAGLAFDAQGRLFMSSDASGEIYVVQNVGAASPGGGGNSTGGGGSTGSGGSGGGSSTGGGGGGSGGSSGGGGGAASSVRAGGRLVVAVSLASALLVFL